jgi:hypothetical protein
MWQRRQGAIPYAPTDPWPWKLLKRSPLLKGSVKIPWVTVNARNVQRIGDLEAFFKEHAGSGSFWKLEALKKRFAFPKIEDIKLKNGTWTSPPRDAWFYEREIPVKGKPMRSETVEGNWFTMQQLLQEFDSLVCAPFRSHVFIQLTA